MVHPIHDDRYQAVATRLRELREQRGLHQQTVAERLGRTQTYVSRYENGGRHLDLIELLDVLLALHADPHEFIDRVLQQPIKALPR